MNIFSHTSVTLAAGGGSSSGSPSHFLPPGHSPTPSSTPVSELSPGKLNLQPASICFANLLRHLLNNSIFSKYNFKFKTSFRFWLRNYSTHLKICALNAN